MEEDRQKPVSIAEIIVENKNPARQGRIPLPIGVGGGMGWSDKAMSGQRTYKEEDDEEIPNGGVIGARLSNNERR